jgi:hypothetical protein
VVICIFVIAQILKFVRAYLFGFGYDTVVTNQTRLQQRLHKRPSGRLDIRSDLLHFSLINYAVPKERLEPHIPTDRFEIASFAINGRQQAMLSVVPFIDADFNFYRLFPWLKFRFAQTNHRVYVIDKKTGEPVVWFFGTTLGSQVVHLARTLWRIPWHHGRYQINCQYDEESARYQTYAIQIKSAWCQSQIEIEDSGQPVQLTDEERLILTHPVDGYFYRLDGRVGGYSIWHEIIPLTTAAPKNLYFSLYEDLNIMSREEMQQPHSIFICPRIAFDIYMPPQPK